MRTFLLLPILAVTLLATSDAFASRARESVLGTGDSGYMLSGGSLYFDQDYNIFYNPSYVNDFKDWAIVEKSNFPGKTAAGGFITAIGPVNVGLYMNRGNALMNNLAWSATTPIRPLELFVGSSFGSTTEVKWGVSLTEASNTAAGGSSSYSNLGLGAQVGGLEPFATILLTGTEKTAGGSEITRSGLRIGARYKWIEWIPYAVFGRFKGNAATETKDTIWVFGLGRNTKLTDGVKLYYALSWMNDSQETAGTKTTGIVPINMGLEGDVASWLTLRAGFEYHIVDKYAGTVTQDNTYGRFGASVHLNRVDFDMAVGRAGPVGENGSGASVPATATAMDSQNFDLANGFFSLASLRYHW